MLINTGLKENLKNKKCSINLISILLIIHIRIKQCLFNNPYSVFIRNSVLSVYGAGNTYLSYQKGFHPVTYILWKYISCRNIPLLIVSNFALNPIKSTGKFPVPTYQSFMNQLRNNLSIPALGLHWL